MTKETTPEDPLEYIRTRVRIWGLRDSAQQCRVMADRQSELPRSSQLLLDAAADFEKQADQLADRARITNEWTRCPTGAEIRRFAEQEDMSLLEAGRLILDTFDAKDLRAEEAPNA